MDRDTEEALSSATKIIASWFSAVLAGFGGFYLSSFVAYNPFDYALFHAVASATAVATFTILWANKVHEVRYPDEEDDSTSSDSH